jgi:hypothetical protein
MTSRLAEHQIAASLPKGRGKVPGCGEPIDGTRLMCRRHWNRAPKQLRDQVWSTWRSGQGAVSCEHQHAVLQALAIGRAA